ncbi:1375_t:CDS:2 [Racocetra persica]|uniref:1375_t:CDS:1 n=1 Tax=Racocetra persica TaxID=160502 RepID=A0ACA9QKI6_9GLOM|nr:1375_t:CDS:2 [Racocetra persica]
MSNWPLPSPDIQYFLRTLPAQNSAGHPLGPLWQAFHLVQTDKKPKAKCIFCSPDKPISDQQLGISSDESIIPSMSASNCSIASIQANHFFSPPPVDINESNNLLLEAIIEGGAPLSFVESKKFKQFVYSINTRYHVPARKQLSNKILDVYKKVQKSIYQFICKFNWISIVIDRWTNIRQDHIINFMAIGKNRQVELVKIKDTFGESQNSMVIFRDLENTVIQVGIEKINAIITDGAANYVRIKAMFNQQYSRILSLPCTAHESNLLVGDMLKHTYMKLTISLTNSFFVSLQQVQNNEQYLKDTAYEMGSRLDKYIISILKDNVFWNHLQNIIHILELYSHIPIILESQHATLADVLYLWA